MAADREREQRVLIAAPTGRDADILCRIVQDAGIAASVCAGLEELCIGKSPV